MITKLQVKYIQSLGQKKFRDQEGVFVAEGPKIINELLGAGIVALQALYATHEWIQAHTALLQQLPVSAAEVKDHELERISFLQTPNAVAGIFKKPVHDKAFSLEGCLLMLDGIQDPGNMGTIIRIADWFGINTIMCSTDCVDAFAPKVVQGSMGSVVRVNTVYADLPELAKANKDLILYAATLNGENINRMQPLQKGVIVIGNESKGIRPELLASCTQRITIPRIGHAESLNAAVATGIILSRLVGVAAT